MSVATSGVAAEPTRALPARSRWLRRVDFRLSVASLGLRVAIAAGGQAEAAVVRVRPSAAEIARVERAAVADSRTVSA